MRRLLAGLLALAVGAAWYARPEPDAAPVAHEVTGDAGDRQATTTFDGPMVRRRAAIAIHPAPGADRAAIARELRALAAEQKLGELTDATFAVFSERMLEFLVPEMTLVLDEGVPVMDAEALMRDHQPASVAFYLVQPVLVHDLTFCVLTPAGVTPELVRERQDAEGVLSDSLNRYVTEVQPAGVTVRYFGAVLGDGQVAAVRESMGRAAGVPASQVHVTATEPGPGASGSTQVDHTLLQEHVPK
ncbi:hypothetical protein GCM10010112_03790 [Actinoplanes lobatus]|uniref:Uncharacterized protein n=1 Tax=Actinoplanes lobatus TaxID=113568 RepID=A0A7W7HA42_9ACTN|nr:hypothetical protein [Actinoplanes lobatus]MBB4746799.1 hypothetical protein [Actinoplanes lobatus]GGN54224.1 hypothetical protein GCM10010112_03790 [Actinoplanes lobatus]GIE38865.1 hypothetical protein Alo02nite_17630 [Actinoplanes lobatus]